MEKSFGWWITLNFLMMTPCQSTNFAISMRIAAAKEHGLIVERSSVLGKYSTIAIIVVFDQDDFLFALELNLIPQLINNLNTILG